MEEAKKEEKKFEGFVLDLETAVHDGLGKPAKENNEPVTIRDVLAVLFSNTGGVTAKETLTLNECIHQVGDEKATSVTFSVKRIDFLRKIAKANISVRGEPVLSPLAQGQLLIALGLKEEDL